jgi:hypothetical protein
LIDDIALPVSYDWVLLGSRLLIALLLLLFFWRVLIVVRRESMMSGVSRSSSLGLLGANSTVVRVFRLSRRRSNTIGRDGTSDIVLADGSVSSRHATIAYQDGTWIIHDVGSRNGTFLNGSPVLAPIEMREGDHLQFGAVRMVLLADETGI